MSTEEKKIEVTRTINASAKNIFQILSNPERHKELDSTSAIVSDSKSDRISGTGQVFTMNMTGDHMGGDYQTDNKVVGFDENKLISWETYPAGTEPKGWSWTWRLDPLDEGNTEVTHVYDWSGVTDPEIIGLFPFADESQLEDSLNKLAAAVAS